jgi:hypothetical protein
MTTKSIEIGEFSGAKGPYGGDPYFRGPLMNPLLPYPNIKHRIYVTNEIPTNPAPITTMPILVQPVSINYILYISIAIVISLGILILLLRK